MSVWFSCVTNRNTPFPLTSRAFAQGPDPLYAGFGSIVLDDSEQLYRAIIGAAKRCGVRARISCGWSKLGGDACNTADVFHLGDCADGKYGPKQAIRDVQVVTVIPVYIQNIHSQGFQQSYTTKELAQPHVAL
jgi:hypothetical protein